MKVDQTNVMTSVMKLDTGEIWEYMLSPKEAVRNAFLQAQGNYRTDEYPPADLIVKVSPSGKTVYAGDFVALAKTKKGVDISKNI